MKINVQSKSLPFEGHVYSLLIEVIEIIRADMILKGAHSLHPVNAYLDLGFTPELHVEATNLS
jgi:hypothetical protein